MFKGVISLLLIQNQSLVSPIGFLQYSSSVSYLSWVYLALIFSWLSASLQGRKISLREPFLKKLFSAFKIKRQPGDPVLPAQVPVSTDGTTPQPTTAVTALKATPSYSSLRHSSPRYRAPLCYQLFWFFRLFLPFERSQPSSALFRRAPLKEFLISHCYV